MGTIGLEGGRLYMELGKADNPLSLRAVNERMNATKTRRPFQGA